MKQFTHLTLFLLAGLCSFISVASEAQQSVKEPSFLITDGQSESVTENKYEGIEITVNINSASVEELAALLIGIGEKKAQFIVEYREKYGRFESAEDLMQVKGIGPSTIEKNRNRIQL